MLVTYNYETIKSFEEIFKDLFTTTTIDSTGVKTPVHDTIETDKEYIIEILLGGVERKNISIDVEEDELVIKAERKPDETLKYNKKQTYFGNYEKSFILPDNVDVEKINASLSDGILKITIPKIEDPKKLSKSIKIT